jgi:hypothetical protein
MFLCLIFLGQITLEAAGSQYADSEEDPQIGVEYGHDNANYV